MWMLARNRLTTLSILLEALVLLNIIVSFYVFDNDTAVLMFYSKL